VVSNGTVVLHWCVVWLMIQCALVSARVSEESERDLNCVNVSLCGNKTFLLILSPVSFVGGPGVVAAQLWAFLSIFSDHLDKSPTCSLLSDFFLFYLPEYLHVTLPA